MNLFKRLYLNTEGFFFWGGGCSWTAEHWRWLDCGLSKLREHLTQRQRVTFQKSSILATSLWEHQNSHPNGIWWSKNYEILLTPWCRVLLEKLTGLQPVKKFPTFHGTRRFITALTSVRHLSLSWANPIHSTYPHPTSWRSILILSTHLRLGLPSGLFPSGFPTKTL